MSGILQMPVHSSIPQGEEILHGFCSQHAEFLALSQLYRNDLNAQSRSIPTVCDGNKSVYSN